MRAWGAVVIAGLVLAGCHDVDRLRSVFDPEPAPPLTTPPPPEPGMEPLPTPPLPSPEVPRPRETTPTPISDGLAPPKPSLGDVTWGPRPMTRSCVGSSPSPSATRRRSRPRCGTCTTRPVPASVAT